MDKTRSQTRVPFEPCFRGHSRGLGAPGCCRRALFETVPQNCHDCVSDFCGTALPRACALPRKTPFLPLASPQHERMKSGIEKAAQGSGASDRKQPRSGRPHSAEPRGEKQRCPQTAKGTGSALDGHALSQGTIANLAPGKLPNAGRARRCPAGLEPRGSHQPGKTSLVLAPRPCRCSVG